MKAKMYNSENRFEVLVSNKVYTSIEGEDKKSFTKRVKSLLESDFDEAIDIVEIKVETIKSLNDVMLVEAYKVSKGIQEELILAELTVRNISVEKVEKIARKKIEKVDVEVMKASKEYLEAKANVGKLASYIPNKSEEVVSGVIKSISLNKTNTIIYYNIQSGTALRCCTAKNETLTFHEF